MRRVHLLVAAVTVAVASVAVAQQAGRRPVLHEDLPGPSDRPTPLIGDTGSGGNPTAIVAGDKVLPPPPLEAKTDGKSEPVLGKGGFAADRETEMKPDENTGSDNTLHYVSVFNPDVLPFKRMSSFDAVGDDYTLHVGRTVLTDLPVGGTTDKMRDRFWGSVAVELTPGTDVPLPSVAPDMRILSYQIKPKVALRFEKDGADNFYVRSDDAHASGTYRLVFLADADAGYFAPSLPAQRLTARQVAAMAPPELKPALPARAIKAAHRTIERLGIDPDEALATSFNRLVGFFRAFTAKPAPPRTDDVYRDLCDSQAGVCRHRSFAFMITANALGIPTRFVSNEAHAFVEVWFPQRGWQRIDLGGAALKMEVSGANDKTLHRPRADDPFEKPPEYKNNYTQLEGDISGLTDQQLADKHRPTDNATASGSFSGPGNGPGHGSGGNGGNDSGDEITPDPTLPALATDPKKPTPHLAITTADTAAYRGDSVHVEGQASVAGKGLPDHRIDVFLAPVGQHGQHAVKIGTAFTAADGTFKVDLEIPKSMELKQYELYLSSPEDAYFNGALTTE
jgi:transglutaminase-like putative cysteine protease